MSLYARAAIAALASRQAPGTPDVNQITSDASKGQCDFGREHEYVADRYGRREKQRGFLLT
jgi:hypothetical protein